MDLETIKNYSADEATSFLLDGADLSEWQTGFLAVALEEVAEWNKRTGSASSISCEDCVDELVQMNSLHRNSIEPVVYALTGVSFRVSWRGSYGARTFNVSLYEKGTLQSRAEFDTLHVAGGGSDAHREALRRTRLRPARFFTGENTLKIA